MVKEHTLGLMEKCMYVDLRSVDQMDKEPLLHLMETSMKGNSLMGKGLVREHSNGLMETSM